LYRFIFLTPFREDSSKNSVDGDAFRLGIVQTGCVKDEPNNRQSSCFPGTVRSFVICDDALTPCNFDYFVGLGLIPVWLQSILMALGFSISKHRILLSQC
jgi:hypothetical protein